MNQDDNIRKVQRLREFSHYKAAQLFSEGVVLLRKEPQAALRKFTTVVEIDHDNPWGWIYLLFAKEECGFPLKDLVNTCNKLVEAAEKHPMHGLDGIARMMMVKYIEKKSSDDIKMW